MNIAFTNWNVCICLIPSHPIPSHPIKPTQECEISIANFIKRCGCCFCNPNFVDHLTDYIVGLFDDHWIQSTDKSTSSVQWNSIRIKYVLVHIMLALLIFLVLIHSNVWLNSRIESNQVSDRTSVMNENKSFIR